MSTGSSPKLLQINAQAASTAVPMTFKASGPKDAPFDALSAKGPELAVEVLVALHCCGCVSCERHFCRAPNELQALVTSGRSKRRNQEAFWGTRAGTPARRSRGSSRDLKALAHTLSVVSPISTRSVSPQTILNFLAMVAKFAV